MRNIGKWNISVMHRKSEITVLVHKKKKKRENTVHAAYKKQFY